ncbi:hypothetical protein JOD43_002542 [Pullulanibacillus pueri]|uniref:Uncharacterized protein n=1 Tax=Pullulanibacillus pueri TaxID=1437324 RepID=A0A8J3ELS8_9BACL|nr:hypothetical protein [Pullulanibacillus pueri]MBM7682367.1 hypothetical protein [Pullulanibacillus pueri]GGH80626.1 hypothetical protein GCM10007096_17310 [Pullulanibacillus pueri]
MAKNKKSKAERRRDREILNLYHQKVTEDELRLLFENFRKWDRQELPYYELTDLIHEFHKKIKKYGPCFKMG